MQLVYVWQYDVNSVLKKNIENAVKENWYMMSNNVH